MERGTGITKSQLVGIIEKVRAGDDYVFLVANSSQISYTVALARFIDEPESHCGNRLLYGGHYLEFMSVRSDAYRLRGVMVNVELDHHAENVLFHELRPHEYHKWRTEIENCRRRAEADKRRKSMAVTDETFNPSGSDAVKNIKEAALAFEKIIQENCPEGRRRSVALTNLETTSMWAVKSVFEP